MFANGPGDRSSIPGRIIPKTPKTVLNAALLSTQHYKVRIKGKLEQSRRMELRPPLQQAVVAIEKGTFGSPSTKVTNFTYISRIWHMVNFQAVKSWFECSFSSPSQVAKIRLLPNYWWGTYGLMNFPKTLAWRETQTAWCKIWTLIANSISFDDKCAFVHVCVIYLYQWE